MNKQNINLYLASPRGFCAGVDRAVKIVEEALKKYGPPVYVRHEIVHNEEVVDSLTKAGAVFVEEVSEAPENSIMIFSAHGVPKTVFKEAKHRKMISIDATCPLVTKVHNETKKHSNKGNHILLIGHEFHPEVVGTMGQVSENEITLIQNKEDANNVIVKNPDKLAYATQTTLSVEDTEVILKILKSRFPRINGPSTDDICYATTNRQLAVKSMAKICDCILVIGSKNSSNSKRLVEVAKVNGAKEAFLISSEDDLTYFLKNYNPTFNSNLGLTSGASAPETLIKVLITKLNKKFEVCQIDHEVIKEDIHFNLPKSLRSI